MSRSQDLIILRLVPGSERVQEALRAAGYSIVTSLSFTLQELHRFSVSELLRSLARRLWRNANILLWSLALFPRVQPISRPTYAPYRWTTTTSQSIYDMWLLLDRANPLVLSYTFEQRIQRIPAPVRAAEREEKSTPVLQRSASPLFVDADLPLFPQFGDEEVLESPLPSIRPAAIPVTIPYVRSGTPTTVVENRTSDEQLSQMAAQLELALQQAPRRGRKSSKRPRLQSTTRRPGSLVEVDNPLGQWLDVFPGFATYRSRTLYNKKELY